MCNIPRVFAVLPHAPSTCQFKAYTSERIHYSLPRNLKHQSEHIFTSHSITFNQSGKKLRWRSSLQTMMQDYHQSGTTRTPQTSNRLIPKYSKQILNIELLRSDVGAKVRTNHENQLVCWHKYLNVRICESFFSVFGECLGRGLTFVIKRVLDCCTFLGGLFVFNFALLHLVKLKTRVWVLVLKQCGLRS